jgi:anti-sigma regulatory factor (Ser/Thr protein kinase)
MALASTVLARGRSHKPALAGVPDPEDTGLFLISLATVRGAPHAARYKAGTILAEWNISQDHADTALLLISELVTNAVHFGKASGKPQPSEITLALWLTPGILAIEVSDQSAELPVRRHAGPESESGRGLNMVYELSREWGFYVPRPGWKTVYCVISIRGRE